LIHAFAIDPELAATWSSREEFRFIHDKFGLGTPRVFLEFPEFTDWKNHVYSAAGEMGLSEKDWKRLEEVFRIFTEHRCRRTRSVYDVDDEWLSNAESEHARRSYRAILSNANPRRNAAVVVGSDIGQAKATLWQCESGCAPARTANDFAITLAGMLQNCRLLHFVDPHFSPEKRAHREVLESLLNGLMGRDSPPDEIRVHCKEKSTLLFFEQEASQQLPRRIPRGIDVHFTRWSEKYGGEKLHNRYVLTDLGGVSFGVGLDAGQTGQTDDILLLPRKVYELRWDQYVNGNGSFDLPGNQPSPIRGTRS